MDADNQARPVLDRMAVDFAQMVKRSDVDFFGKNTAAPNSPGGAMTGNDQIAFFSAVPGYPPSGSQSPVSLVAYRVNTNPSSSNYNKLVRMGKGLLWNGVSSTTDTPMVFFPLTIAATWPKATDPTQTDTGYEEVVGPEVFRFEYYYYLNSYPQKSGYSDSATPWDSSSNFTPPHTSVSGLRDVGAIVVTIATIDPKSRALVSNAQLASLAGKLPDYVTFNSPGNSGQVGAQLQSKWQDAVNSEIAIPTLNPPIPKAVLSGIRFYERYFYLNGQQQ